MCDIIDFRFRSKIKINSENSLVWINQVETMCFFAIKVQFYCYCFDKDISPYQEDNDIQIQRKKCINHIDIINSSSSSSSSVECHHCPPFQCDNQHKSSSNQGEG